MPLEDVRHPGRVMNALCLTCNHCGIAYDRENHQYLPYCDTKIPHYFPHFYRLKEHFDKFMDPDAFEQFWENLKDGVTCPNQQKPETTELATKTT